MNILYLCEADRGGIAEYAVRQADALAATGAKVTLLCRPSLRVERVMRAKVVALLPASRVRASFVPRRIVEQVLDLRDVAETAVFEARSGSYDALLIACFAEYFAPFWAGIYRRIARRLPVGTIAHDPVRDFVLGPVWWHRWSIRQGYSFVSHVFVHDETPVDFGGEPPTRATLHVIPHGPFEVIPARDTQEAVRHRYGFVEGDRVFLAFGQIRDGKNLDRFLHALLSLPKHVKLLVAGSGGSGSQRPPAYYQAMAEELGIAGRCRWDLRYIPDEETAELFGAADFILMTYSAKFRSASGVLNTAVSCRRPVLASSGAGPLRSSVQGYGLGVFIEPDDDAAILRGAERLLGEPMIPEWDRYEQENSWDENARRVVAAFAQCASGSTPVS